MQGFVYVLELCNGRHYVGSTQDLVRRLDEHHRGEVRSTKYCRPVSLLFAKEFATIQEARSKEYAIKKQKSSHVVQKFIDGEF